MIYRRRLDTRKCLRNCYRRHSRVSGDPAVQLPEEWAAAPFVILPCVLAIENDRNQSIPSACNNAGAVVANANHEVIGGLGGSHPGIHETDQIAEITVAKHSVQRATGLLPKIRLVGRISIRGAVQ